MSLPIAILDSSIYINHLRSDRFKENISFARQRFLVRQCSVVLHELRRGAQNRQAVRLIEDLLKNSTEILNPTDTDWWRAAQILQGLMARKTIQASRLKNLQNDCLIALCARRVGGVVITVDRNDFTLLEKSILCPVLYW